MTEQEWNAAERDLKPVFSCVNFAIDGYRIAVHKRLINDMKLGFVVFVNGELKGEWLLNDCDIRRRFMRPTVRKLFTGARCKKMQQLEKATGLALGAKVKVKAAFFYWNSFAAMKKHFIANNKKIELVR